MSDYDDWWAIDEEVHGPPEELMHVALTREGAWGLGFKDALELREHVDAGKPPLGDSSWRHELDEQLRSQLHPDICEIVHRIAWAAYRQGILHGEFMLKHRIDTLLSEGLG